MNIHNIGFIGFGLIGGSIALSLRNKQYPCNIIVYDHHTEVNQDYEQALKDQTINQLTNQLNDLHNCDLIFLCAPVLRNIEYLSDLKQIIKPDTIITDVGSVKGEIHRAVEVLEMSSYFIGGHPMAGSEKTGYKHASSYLYENAYYILTPTNSIAQEKVDFMIELVQLISAIPIVLQPEEHDDITAAISHLPHVIAVELVNLIRETDDPSGKMRLLAAGGFKDITRIASSSPAMWESICMSNHKSLQKFLLKYIHRLEHIYMNIALEDNHSIYHAFDTANEYRSSIPNTKGLIQKFFDIYVDIIDETGAIATIAVLLASHNISIKNIGIIHNREFEEGVLRIEFYDETSLKRAVSILREENYTIFIR